MRKLEEKDQKMNRIEKDRKMLFPHFEHQIVLSKQTQFANDAITKRVIAQCDSRTEVLQPECASGPTRP